MNMLAMTTNNKNAVNQIYNTAYGERTTLNQLVGYLKEFLSEFDSEIIQVEVIHGPNRLGIYPILWLVLTKPNRYWAIIRNTVCARG